MIVIEEIDAGKALREAYEAIPEHNRRYVLGDMDKQDRRIIYGKEK